MQTFKQALIAVLILLAPTVFGQDDVGHVSYLPHYTFKDGDWATDLSFVNTSLKDQDVTITAYDNNGHLAGAVTTNFAPMAGFSGSVQSLLPELGADIGWLELNASREPVEGIMKFSMQASGASSSLPLTVETGKRLLMPLLENDDHWAGGFAVTNVSEADTDLRVTLSNFDGVVLYQSNQTLAARAKLVTMLADLFDGDLPAKGLLTVESSQPVTGFALSFQRDNSQMVSVPARVLNPIDISDEDRLLNDTFRIDLDTITAALDYTPAAGQINGEATLTFRMRPGQSKAIVNLGAEILAGGVSKIVLDGEELDFNDPNDVTVIETVGVTDHVFLALEFHRNLSSDDLHTLEMTYSRADSEGLPGALFVSINDILGFGNENWFPTINTPAEFARHHVTFRIHSDAPYKMMGGGDFIENEMEGGQEWVLDSEREIASYTLFFIGMPESMISYSERVVDNVQVRMMSFAPAPGAEDTLQEDGYDVLETWLPELRNNLGPFPMDRGLNIFMLPGGGGIEHFGGTLTSLRALRHEIFHMYYGCSVVAKTFRDSWWDEAINNWYSGSAAGTLTAIPDDFESGMLSNRTAATPGFDIRAYQEGAQIFEAVAQELGGRDRMIEFLAYVNQNYVFAPFNTDQLLDYLNDFAGIDMKPKFAQWMRGEDQVEEESEAAKAIHDHFHGKIPFFQ